MVPSSQGQADGDDYVISRDFTLIFNGDRRGKKLAKKGWKNNNPKSSLRNGVSPEPQNLQKDFLNLKNRTDKNKLKFYHMSSRKNTRFTCQITYYIQFYFCSQQFSHQKWSFLGGFFDEWESLDLQTENPLTYFTKVAESL